MLVGHTDAQVIGILEVIRDLTNSAATDEQFRIDRLGVASNNHLHELALSKLAIWSKTNPSELRESDTGDNCGDRSNVLGTRY